MTQKLGTTPTQAYGKPSVAKFDTEGSYNQFDRVEWQGAVYGCKQDGTKGSADEPLGEPQDYPETWELLYGYRFTGDGVTSTTSDHIEIAGGGGSGYTLPVATDSVLGGVKIGDNLSITDEGVLSVPIATKTKLGVVKPGECLGTYRAGANAGTLYIETVSPIVKSANGIILISEIPFNLILSLSIDTTKYTASHVLGLVNGSIQYDDTKGIPNIDKLYGQAFIIASDNINIKIFEYGTSPDNDYLLTMAQYSCNLSHLLETPQAFLMYKNNELVANGMIYKTEDTNQNQIKACFMGSTSQTIALNNSDVLKIEFIY